MRARSRAFTLIELITVIAISAILLTLILIPVIQSFNLTRAAQGFADAQDRARILIDSITREISNSSGVRDNSGVRGSLGIVLPGQNGNPAELILDGVKLDIVKPAQGNPGNIRDGAFVNPDTNKADPTLKAPRGDVLLPVAPGATLVRYFVGLRRPLVQRGGAVVAGTYNNPYDGLLMARNANADNLYVLYRAEVQPRIYNSSTGRFEVNRQLFLDVDNDGEPDYDDAWFFQFRPGIDYNVNDQSLTQAGQQKANRVQAWIGRSSIVTEISRYDMVQTQFDRRTRQVIWDGNAPRVVPLISFFPTRITSEPAEGQVALRSGDEAPNIRKIGSETFRTEYGGWTSLFMRVWPSRFPNAPFDSASFSAVWPAWDRNLVPGYVVGRPGVDGNGAPLPFSLYFWDGTGSEVSSGTELFDAYAYVRARDADPTVGAPDPLFAYPFSFGVSQANARSGWLGDQALRDAFVPIVPAPREGKATASFAITEVGNGSQLPPGRDNRPSAATGPALTPGNDTGLTGSWSDAVYAPSSPTQQINRRFNKLWVEWANLVPSQGGQPVFARETTVKRFIDLRVLPNLDGSLSPLHPTSGFARARIVPGSEVVIGPDQRPGQNYGRYVRYARTTERPVGKNQYYINYVHQREPEDWAALGFNVPADIYDARTYTPNNLVSAILQPVFRAGYLELNSNFGEPLPEGYLDSGGQFVATGNILVSYRFQFTEPNDVVAVDYDSRQVIGINLTIRNYPQTTLPNPQTITVKGTATVRNFIR